MARQIWRYFSPALALVVIGCTDTVLPRAELAAPRTTTAPPGAPPEYHGESVIFNTWLDVGFDQDAKKAYVMSRMEFYATSGRIDATLQVRRGTSTIAQRTLTTTDRRWYLWRRELANNANWLTVGQTCGHIIHGSAQFAATNEWEGWVWSDKTEARTKDTQQPDCNCSNGVPIRQTTYDPYDPGAGNCDGSGGGDGSGIQYGEGDYTGGETVSWATGTGAGGGSACGAEARVAYICIDIWDGTGWVEWGCGYVTTC